MSGVTRNGFVGLAAAALAAAGCLATGCAGSGTAKTPPGEGDPLTVAKDPEAHTSARIRAVERIWEEAEAGRLERAAAREQLKSIIWTRQPGVIRTRAIEVLLLDERDEGVADTRNMLGLRLPTETDWSVIGLICDTAATRGWTDLTPAIVRSYARPVQVPADEERLERRALERLHPGVSVEETVYRVFAARPAPGLSELALERAERARRDAWELLGRLDPDGSARRELLAAEGDGSEADPMLATLRRSARELRAVPVTGSELEWVLRLREPDAAAWWAEAAAAVGGLSEAQARGLCVRHVEAVRWAARHRPEWTEAGRDELLSELRSRLEGRRIYEREAEVGTATPARRERLRENEASLAWGDVLSILVIDEALRGDGVVSAFFEQAETDRRDTSTEHGGVLVAAGLGDPGFHAVAYPPRPAQRVNDTTFIAPEDMFRQAPTALAHYHFHVQSARNRAYAGPGPGDADYANKHGRSCVVLTSLDENRLNVDYYQRGGAVVDLGVIER